MIEIVMAQEIVDFKLCHWPGEFGDVTPLSWASLCLPLKEEMLLDWMIS